MSINGQTLAYLKTGQGPALVIVHGVGGHKEDWQAVMAALAPTRTVYAIDMLGFGGSSRGAPDLSMNAQAAALKALLDAQGVARADLIGNSVGGWVTATFAANYPGQVDKLVLVNAAGFKAMFDGEPPVKFFSDQIEDVETLLKHVLFSDFAHTREFAQQVLSAQRASGEAQIEARLGQGLFGSTRIEDLGPRISAPTLVVWGSEDKLFAPPLADVVAGSIAGTRKVLVARAGHFPHVDNLQGFLEPVQAFLNR